MKYHETKRKVRGARGQTTDVLPCALNSWVLEGDDKNGKFNNVLSGHFMYCCLFFSAVILRNSS